MILSCTLELTDILKENELICLQSTLICSIHFPTRNLHNYSSIKNFSLTIPISSTNRSTRIFHVNFLPYNFSTDYSSFSIFRLKFFAPIFQPRNFLFSFHFFQWFSYLKYLTLIIRKIIFSLLFNIFHQFFNLEFYRPLR